MVAVLLNCQVTKCMLEVKFSNATIELEEMCVRADKLKRSFTMAVVSLLYGEAQRICRLLYQNDGHFSRSLISQHTSVTHKKRFTP